MLLTLISTLFKAKKLHLSPFLIYTQVISNKSKKYFYIGKLKNQLNIPLSTAVFQDVFIRRFKRDANFLHN